MMDDHVIDWRTEAISQAELIAGLYRRLVVHGELLSMALSCLAARHTESRKKDATIRALREELRRGRAGVPAAA
jgi:hypothetical protein